MTRKNFMVGLLMMVGLTTTSLHTYGSTILDGKHTISLSTSQQTSSGCKIYTGSVDCYGTDTWTLNLTEEEYTRILVSGDGDTDLNVYLFDNYGNVVDSETDTCDKGYLEVTPEYTGKYTLIITNQGGVGNEYRIYIKQTCPIQGKET